MLLRPSERQLVSICAGEADVRLQRNCNQDKKEGIKMSFPCVQQQRSVYLGLWSTSCSSVATFSSSAIFNQQPALV